MTIETDHISNELNHYSRNRASPRDRRTNRKIGVIRSTRDPTITIEDIKVYAKNKGGQVLEKNYVDQYSIMTWRCKNDHKFTASLNKIHGGQWCPQCARDNKSTETTKKPTKRPRKNLDKRFTQRKVGVIASTADPTITIEDLMVYAKNKGGKVLDDKYRNPDFRINWQCKRGHHFRASLKKVHGGRWCPLCKFESRGKNKDETSKSISKGKIKRRSRKKRSSLPGRKLNRYEQFNRLKHKVQGTCLSTKFLGWNRKHEWMCKCGASFRASPAEISRGDWCRVCIPETSHESCGETVDENIKKDMQNNTKKKGESQVTKNPADRELSVETNSDNSQQGNNENNSHTPTEGFNKLASKDISSLSSDEKLDYLRQLADIKEGKCLAAEYTNGKTRILWECSEGHKFYKTPNNVRHKNGWCNRCKGIFEQIPDDIPPNTNDPRSNGLITPSKDQSKKREQLFAKIAGRDISSLSRDEKLQYLHDLAEIKGGKCLAKIYTKNSDKVLWECADGHRFYKTPDTVRRKNGWCNRCKGIFEQIPDDIPPEDEARSGQTETPKKKPKQTLDTEKRDKSFNKLATRDISSLSSHEKLEYLQHLATLKKGKCLAAEYTNGKTKVPWECSEGHKFYKTPNNVRHKNGWCNRCKGIFEQIPDNVPPKTGDKQAIQSPIKARASRSKTQLLVKSKLKRLKTNQSTAASNAAEKKYSLFAFDLNNLTVRYRSMDQQKRNGSPVAEILLYMWKAVGHGKFKAWWFVSENMADGLKLLRDPSVHKVHIERHYKNASERTYMDIDTALCVNIARIIERDHEKIEHFYLGSGDKDMYHLVHAAREYEIPVTVIGTRHEDVSRELERSADEVKILF